MKEEDTFMINAKNHGKLKVGNSTTIMLDPTLKLSVTLSASSLQRSHCRTSRKKKHALAVAQQPTTVYPIGEQLVGEEEPDSGHHGSPVSSECLKSMPRPPRPFNRLPDTGMCKWTHDTGNNIITADFTSSFDGNKNFALHSDDMKFFLEVMERDDITLVSQGLIAQETLDSPCWSPQNIGNSLGDQFYHKFRPFDKVIEHCGFESHVERMGWMSMKGKDYVKYLEKRQQFQGREQNGIDRSDFLLTFDGEDGKNQDIDVCKCALYMIDVDMVNTNNVRTLGMKFVDSFRLKSILPGGRHCLMHGSPPDSRPFLGPNLFVTPPGAFTHFHQDGHGTVDSGHFCISGYNEVVMLRRLTEEHKQNALEILTANEKIVSKDTYGLYSEPHDDKCIKPKWPTQAQITKCRSMGYCPAVFILKPGQFLHINKGRLHAFRKMSTSFLEDADCHSKLRRDTIRKCQLRKEIICISVAWDWVYRGVSTPGIHAETSSVLEAAAVAVKNERVPLANPEFCIFQMADFLLKSSRDKSSTFDIKTICHGILPCLRHLTEQQLKYIEVARKQCESNKKVSMKQRADTSEKNSLIDPFRLDGFECKICFRELSNVYYHCDGCEDKKVDFNICHECHVKEFYKNLSHQFETFKHTGRGKHASFTFHNRIFGREELLGLLIGVEKLADCNASQEEQNVSLQSLLNQRLKKEELTWAVIESRKK